MNASRVNASAQSGVAASLGNAQLGNAQLGMNASSVVQQSRVNNSNPFSLFIGGRSYKKKSQKSKK